MVGKLLYPRGSPETACRTRNSPLYYAQRPSSSKGQSNTLLKCRLCVRFAPGVHEPPRIDPERFLSMIRFDSRQKLDDLPDFHLDS